MGHSRLVAKLCLAVVAMFGLGFALVPLYDVFCEITGINGKPRTEAVAQYHAAIDVERTVTVEFITYVRKDMPWQFEPMVHRLEVHPGETTEVAFMATNLSDQDLIGQAIPSVSPGQGALYFSKIACFCFNHQPLLAGETTEMGLMFYVDPELPPSIQTLTLSYTLYNITDRVAAPG
ncbi:MAG: cytochrome c oxidase assembly protein [Ferrimonas sp.]